MHTLPKLPYDYNSLEPFIDEQTMRIHHTKHHQTYVDKLNSTLEKYPDLQNIEIEKLLSDLSAIPAEIKQAVINHGGGHYNHDFFWKIMTPPSLSKIPSEGKLFDAINAEFGGFETFKEKFIDKAIGVFGSGWAFLIKTKEGKLALKRHSFQNTPISQGNIPLLTVDIWEHAYYLKYQNRRNEYLDAWWNVVNWSRVEENFTKSS
jgi:Fe-Mn family superoxide dismutase